MLTPREQRNLKRLCDTPMSRHRWNLKCLILSTIAGHGVVVAGLIWMLQYRSITATQAVLFATLVAFNSAAGFVVMWVLNYKHVKMIHSVCAGNGNVRA